MSRGVVNPVSSRSGDGDREVTGESWEAPKEKAESSSSRKGNGAGGPLTPSSSVSILVANATSSSDPSSFG